MGAVVIFHVGLNTARLRAMLVGVALCIAAWLSLHDHAAVAAGWTAPLVITELTGDGAPRVAVDRSGTVLAAWVDQSNQVVRFSQRPVGAAFSPSVEVSSRGGQPSCPALETSVDGQVVLAWLRSDGAAKVVQVAVRSPGGEFSAPVSLSSTGADATCPRVVVGSGGEATVAWVRGADPSRVVQASRRSPGGQFSGPVDLSAPGPSPFSVLILRGNDAGAASASWVLGGVVYAAHREPGKPFAATLALSETTDVLSGVGLGAAVVPGGTTTVVYSFRESEQGQESQVRMRVLGSDGTASSTGAGSIPQSGQLVSGTAVSVNAAGAAVVSWRWYDLSQYGNAFTYEGLRASVRSGRLSGWTPPVELERSPTSPGIFGVSLYLSRVASPTAAVDPSGEATVAWRGIDDLVRAAVRPPGGTLGAPEVISSPREKAERPTGATDATGNQSLVWRSTTDGACGCAWMGAHRMAARSFSPPQPLPAPGSAVMTGLVRDELGNAIAAWTSGGAPSGPTLLQVSAYVDRPPVADEVKVPASGVAGVPLAVSGSASSPWSAVTTRWSWGDGAPDSSGATGTHTYAAPGSYTVSARFADTVGNELTVTRPVTILPAAATPSSSPKPKVKRFAAVFATVARRKAPGRRVIGRLRGLILSGVPAGMTVRVRCRAGCVRRLDLTRRWRGTKVPIRLDAPVKKSTVIAISVRNSAGAIRTQRYRFRVTRLGLMGRELRQS